MENQKTAEQIAAELAAAKAAQADALNAKKAEEKAAKADAKKAADAVKAEEKITAKAAKEAEKAKAIEDKKAATAASTAAKADASAAAKAAKEAKRGPEQNGVRRPGAAGLCGQAWAMFDRLSGELRQPVPVSNALEEARKLGLNEANVRCEYARWKKYNGVEGRVAKIVVPAEPAVPATTEGEQAAQ
jgi:hypothetical protein